MDAPSGFFPRVGMAAGRCRGWEGDGRVADASGGFPRLAGEGRRNGQPAIGTSRTGHQILAQSSREVHEIDFRRAIKFVRLLEPDFLSRNCRHMRRL